LATINNIDLGTGAKAIFRIGGLLIFPDPGGISRKGRRIGQIWIANGFWAERF
jgi:hypothetical protein